MTVGGGGGEREKSHIEGISSIITGKRLIVNLGEGLKRVRNGTGHESDKTGVIFIVMCWIRYREPDPITSRLCNFIVIYYIRHSEPDPIYLSCV